jgi:hypothetical protein
VFNVGSLYDLSAPADGRPLLSFVPPVLFLAVPEDLPGSLIFPVTALLDRPVKGDGFIGAIGKAAAAVPAFIRMQDHRGLAFFRVGDKDVNLAYIHAGVAPGAEIRIENHRISGTDNIG